MKKYFILFALAACLVGLFFYIQGARGIFPDFNNHPFHEVTVSIGAGRSTRPIPSFGSEEMPTLRQWGYAFAISKYPTAAACLGRADDGVWSPEAAFPWHRMRTPQQLEVCLFNVARQIGSASSFMEWLSAQSVFHRLSYSQPNTGTRVDVWFSKTMARREAEKGNPVAEMAWPMLSIAAARTVVIDFSANGAPVHIHQRARIL